MLKEQTKEAKSDSDKSEKGHDGYNKGRLIAYYSVVTLLKHQAFAFCIDQKQLGLADIKPDMDLLGLRRNPDVDFGEDKWAIDVMNEEKVKGYLSDSIKLLKDQAIEAKKEADHPKDGSEDYSRGELMAYHSLFSLLKQNASIFSIDEKELGLADIEPKRDLI